eukprot:1148015-Pelagomonas_calceolata.AAC.3
MSSLAAVQADGFYHPPEFNPDVHKSLNKVGSLGPVLLRGATTALRVSTTLTLLEKEPASWTRASLSSALRCRSTFGAPSAMKRSHKVQTWVQRERKCMKRVIVVK